MSVAGTVIVAGVLAKGALTVGMLAGGGDSYWEGTDILGAELPPAAPPAPAPPRFNAANYYTQVAAGLTVVGLWTLFTFLKAGRRS